MRIIGGRWKRTPLPIPEVPGLRPTPDRVRETVFNWLAHLLPDFSQVQAVDLFAGTGALGFEAASRGAARVTLIERNPAAAASLERTCTKLAAQSVHVVRGDALTVARRFADASFDVIFVDPPYDSGLLPDALVESARLLRPGGVAYVEHGGALPLVATSALGLTALRTARAGQVRFALLQRA